MSKQKIQKLNKILDTVAPYLIVWVFLCLVAIVAFSIAIPGVEKRQHLKSLEQQARFEYLPSNSAQTSVTITEPTFFEDVVVTEVLIK